MKVTELLAETLTRAEQKELKKERNALTDQLRKVSVEYLSDDSKEGKKARDAKLSDITDKIKEIDKKLK